MSAPPGHDRGAAARPVDRLPPPRPVLALGLLAALLALLAGLVGWHLNEMLIASCGIGAAAVLLALFLLYRQATGRQAAQQALKDTIEDIRARIGGIVESAMDAIISVDENQRIVLFNRAAEQVFGWPRSAVLGQPLEMLIPERLRASHAAHMTRFGETGVTSRRMGDRTVLLGLRAGNEEFPIEASISQHLEHGRKLYTVILRDVTARMRAEQALRRSREELSELALASSSVREQEKSRIARELHDELAQALTALKMDAAWVREHLPGEQPALAAKLATMQALLDDTVAATRRISADLRPLMLDDLGLIPAVEWLVQNFTQRTGIACELAIGTPELELEDPYATTVFRIIQESLTNAARHARATQVEVTLERSGDAVLLCVRDNGAGFSPDDPRKPNSYGLLGLRERAYLLGGEVRIDSAPGRGTGIEVSIPVGGAVPP